MAAGGGRGGGLDESRWRDTEASAGLGDGRKRERERESLSRWKRERERRRGKKPGSPVYLDAQAGNNFSQDSFGCPRFLRGNPVAPIAESYIYINIYI